MYGFTLLASILIALFLLWAAWFIIRFIHYIASGEYEMDQRLREIGK